MDKRYINCILHVKGDNAYYFDENGKFSSISVKNLNNQSYKNYVCIDGNYYSDKIVIDGFYHSKYLVFVLSQLELGDSFEKFIEIYKKQETKRIFLTNYVLREEKSVSYFFKKDGIFTSIPTKNIKLKPSDFKNVSSNGYWSGYIPKLWNTNTNHLKSVVSQLNVGDSFDYFCNLIPYSKPNPQRIDRFITKISKPDIYRSADNTNNNTFDFIGIEVFFLSTIDKKTAKNYTEKHIFEIFNKVKQILISSKNFEKYGVPINFLKCSYKIDYNTSSIHFLFSLKELAEHNKDDKDKDKDSNNKNDTSDQGR